MVVTGTNAAGLFCHDAGDIVLSSLTGDVIIDFRIMYNALEKSSWSERYTPDSTGKVSIKNMGKVAFDYFPQLGLSVNYSAHSLFPFPHMVGLLATVKDVEGNDVGHFDQTYYYATQRIGITCADYNRFFNRHTRRMVCPDQYIPVTYNLNQQQLIVGVAYKSNNKICYTRIEWQDEDDQFILFQGRNLSPKVIAYRVNDQDGEEITSHDLIYYEALLYCNNELIDKIVFDVDHRHHKQLTHLVFYNLFGFPETIFLNGKDEKSQELDGTYALINDEYLKINTELHENHTINSGYINEITYDSIKDLIRSKEVYRYTGDIMEKITITDIDLKCTQPRTSPLNVKLTYRISKDQDVTLVRPDILDSKVFDETFDYTFT